MQTRTRGWGCPICSGLKPCHCSSLAAKHPRLVQQQWDFAANERRPEDLLPQSTIKAGPLAVPALLLVLAQHA